jgi:hypothetical protein
MYGSGASGCKTRIYDLPTLTVLACACAGFAGT